MANSYTLGSVFIPTNATGKELAKQKYAELEMMAEYMDTDVGFALEPVSDGVIVCHDESIQLEKAIPFIAWLLNEIDSDGHIQLDYAMTCDKARPGAFGGGSSIISRNGELTYCNPTMQAQQQLRSPDEDAGDFETIEAAIDFIRKQPDPTECLIRMVAANIRLDELSCAADLIREYINVPTPVNQVETLTVAKQLIRSSKRDELETVRLSGGPCDGHLSLCSHDTVWAGPDLYAANEEAGYDTTGDNMFRVFSHVKDWLRALPPEVFAIERRNALRLIDTPPTTVYVSGNPLPMPASMSQMLGTPPDRINAWVQLLTAEPEWDGE